MASIGIRMTDDEKQWVGEYAQAHRQSISDFVRTVLFEKLDDELDLKLLNEYSASPPEDKETVSFDEAKRIWGA